jgi:hypothetical protein
MNIELNGAVILLRIGLLTALCTGSRAFATDLSFDGTSGPVDQNYGDRVTSTTMGAFSYGEHGEGFTPNVTVQYDPNGGTAYTWPSGYGDLIRTLYESDSTARLQLKFSGDPGTSVRLLRWDMATYDTFFHPNGVTVNGVAVYGANGATLFSQSNVFVPSTGHIRFDTFLTSLIDTALTLEIDARNVTGGFGNEDVGVDNVVFGQVPEPASAVLVIAGAGTLSTIVRRRKSSRRPTVKYPSRHYADIVGRPSASTSVPISQIANPLSLTSMRPTTGT